MAQRRMFSPNIIDSDAFLDMPVSARELYFQLGMRADDDGFIGNPKRVAKMVGASDDDLKVLLAKRFVLEFENGVIVIKHWRVNNYVRKDWYKPTVYLELRSQLFVKSNGSYTFDESQGKSLLLISRQQFVDEPSTTLTQVRLGKVRLDQSVSEKKETGDNLGKNKGRPYFEGRPLSNKFGKWMIKGPDGDWLDFGYPESMIEWL